MPKNLGGVSPTCVSGNRETNLRSIYGPCTSLWTGSSPSSAMFQEPLEYTAWDNYPWTKEPLWKSRFLEKFQHTTGTKNKTKNTSLDTLKWVQETAWLYLHHTSSKAAQPKAKRDLSPLFVPWVKGRMCVYLASPAVQDTANRSPFSTHPEYWILSYMNGRREKAGRTTDRTLGRHWRNVDPTDCIQMLGRNTYNLLGMSYPWLSPPGPWATSSTPHDSITPPPLWPPCCAHSWRQWWEIR